MKKWVWFSRHTPTTEQLDELRANGIELVEVNVGIALGAVDLTTDEGVWFLVAALKALVAKHNASAIVGVLPVPVLGAMWHVAQDAIMRGDTKGGDTPCYSAWNITRSDEGGRPQFTHKRFVFVGVL